jgi:dienelactone hydrolase
VPSLLLPIFLLGAALLAGVAYQQADVPSAVEQAPVQVSVPAPESKVASAAGQPVEFDSLDIDSTTGRPVRIRGLLFSPADANGKRRPAVLALHGCGGMYSTLKSKRDALSMRHKAMADLLVAEGYVVLFPDSFRSRGVEEICTVESRRRTITQRNRLSDTLGALAWLQQREEVLPDRIAVLGWSHGGSAVLAGLNAKDGKVTDRKAAADYFRAGVAFYPGCSDSLHVKPGYSLAAPLRLFIAGSDDWTPPGPCVNLAGMLRAAGEPVEITVYADTYHGFDGPGTGQQRQRLEVPNGVNPGKGVTVGPNPAARSDAYARLKQFLSERIGS